MSATLLYFTCKELAWFTFLSLLLEILSDSSEVSPDLQPRHQSVYSAVLYWKLSPIPARDTFHKITIVPIQCDIVTGNATCGRILKEIMRWTMKIFG